MLGVCGRSRRREPTVSAFPIQTAHGMPIGRIAGLGSQAQRPDNSLHVAIKAGLVSWNGRKPLLPAPVKLRGGGHKVL